jgi:hypothetical protein
VPSESPRLCSPSPRHPHYPLPLLYPHFLLFSSVSSTNTCSPFSPLTAVPGPRTLPAAWPRLLHPLRLRPRVPPPPIWDASGGFRDGGRRSPQEETD